MSKRILQALLLCFLLCGCSSSLYEKLQPVTITNSVDFTWEPADLTGYTMMRGERGDFRVISMEESIRMFEEKGSGILYFGKDTCDWCQRAAAELNKAAVKADCVIWYVDVDRRFSEVDYFRLMEYIGETCPKDKNGKPEFFAPEVIGVKNGEITGSHVGLTKGFRMENKNTPLTEEQQKEMLEYYSDIIEKTAD